MTGVPHEGNRVGLPVGVGGSWDSRHREVAAVDRVGDVVVPQVEDHAAAWRLETDVLASRSNQVTQTYW